MQTLQDRKIELLQMKMLELRDLAKANNIHIGVNASKLSAVNRILKAESKKAGQAVPPAALPENPQLEAALRGKDGVTAMLPAGPDLGQDGPAQADVKPKGKPGRPLGMTNELARMATMPVLPNPAVEAALSMAFAAWSQVVGVPSVCLTEQEAKDLALPYTQLLHYFGADEAIPPWAMIGVTAAWTTWNIVKGKLALIAATRQSQPDPDTIQVPRKQDAPMPTN